MIPQCQLIGWWAWLLIDSSCESVTEPEGWVHKNSRMRMLQDEQLFQSEDQVGIKLIIYSRRLTSVWVSFPSVFFCLTVRNLMFWLRMDCSSVRPSVKFLVWRATYSNLFNSWFSRKEGIDRVCPPVLWLIQRCSQKCSCGSFSCSGLQSRSIWPVRHEV